jgi:hypothetical protein
MESYDRQGTNFLSDDLVDLIKLNSNENEDMEENDNFEEREVQGRKQLKKPESIMEKIKQENSLLRKKEVYLNEEFEKLKAAYSKLVKEKTNIENKQHGKNFFLFINLN